MGDKELYTIADLSSVWVNVDVYESDIPFVKIGQRADYLTFLFARRAVERSRLLHLSVSG